MFQEIEVVRYMVVKVKAKICGDTDQDLNDHADELMNHLSEKLNYNMTYEGMLEVGGSCDDAIEVPAKIIDTEIVGVMRENPT